ncbi:MAG: hypothetical protein AAF605_06335 [Myxococcota bacterium]
MKTHYPFLAAAAVFLCSSCASKTPTVKTDDETVSTDEAPAPGCSPEAPDACFADALGELEAAKDAADRLAARAKLVEVCELGSGPACGRAALLFLDTKDSGAEVEIKRARELFRAGCELDHAPSCTRVGHLYAQDLPESPAEPGQALQYYARSCKLGDPDGCRHAGVAFRDGVGTPVNVEQAGVLLARSCNADHGPGCHALAATYRKGKPSAENQREAFRATNRACELKVGPACADAGVALEKGNGVDADPELARSAYQFGCALRHPRSCGLLAFAFERGVGGDKDPERAKELYEISCAGGETNACMKFDFFELGECPEDTQATVALTTYSCRRENGVQHGPVRTVYQPGRVQTQGQYEEGKKDGVWSYYYPDGAKQATETYEMGAREGTVQAWYQDGSLQGETTYVNDQIEGYARVFYPDGKKQTEEIRKQGKGPFTQWHNNGQIAISGQFDGPRTIGDWTYYSKSGEVLKKNALGSRGSGAYESYDLEGNKSESGRYRNGLRQGLWTVFGPNGKPLKVVNLNRGTAEGTFKTFHPDGALQEEGSFKDGKRSGRFKEFHPNGKLRFKASYKSDRPLGPATEYDESGRLLREVDFPATTSEAGEVARYHNSLGVRHGTYYRYHSNGTKALQAVWRLGELVESKQWDADGKPVESTDGAQTGSR